MSYLVSGEQPPRLGNAHPSIVPYQVFPTQDGHAILAIGNDEQFRRFTKLAGAPELALDARFATNPARVTNRAVLIPLLEALMRQRPTQSWIAELETVGVPCGPINNFADLEAHEQVRARGIFKTVPHPSAGSMRSVASPMRFSRTQVEDERASPLLGADTQDVLGGMLGLSGEELDALRLAGVV